MLSFALDLTSSCRMSGHRLLPGAVAFGATTRPNFWCSGIAGTASSRIGGASENWAGRSGLSLLGCFLINAYRLHWEARRPRSDAAIGGNPARDAVNVGPRRSTFGPGVPCAVSSLRYPVYIRVGRRPNRADLIWAFIALCAGLALYFFADWLIGLAGPLADLRPISAIAGPAPMPDR